MPKTLRRIVDEAIMDALQRNGWCRTFAAKDLGISIRGIRDHVKRLKKLGYKVEDTDMESYLMVYAARPKRPRPSPPKRLTWAELKPEKEYCTQCGRLFKPYMCQEKCLHCIKKRR